MTATEGLAFAGIIVALVGTYLTYRTGKEARDDAHKVATESRAAASDDARAARLFDARRSVYIDIMDYVYLIETWVDRTEPFFSVAGEPGPPAFPSEEEQRHQSAAIAAFGSPAIRSKLFDFKKAVREFQFAVWALHSEEERWKHLAELHDAGITPPDPAPEDEERDYRRELTDKRAAVSAMVLELMELVNADLAR